MTSMSSVAASGSSGRGYLNSLASAWIPALDGVDGKLAAGARVADVGCGHGASTLLLADAYPASAVTGFDAHDGSIEAARKRAADAGAKRRNRTAERIPQTATPVDLAKLPVRDAGWLRQAAATQATTTTDRVRWASACSQGLKPLAVTQQQFTASHAAEAATYAGLAADQQTTLAIDRIGSLATQEPRMDNWATCHGLGVGASPTRVLDGTYGVTVTQAEVVASGDRADCGPGRQLPPGRS